LSLGYIRYCWSWQPIYGEFNKRLLRVSRRGGSAASGIFAQLFQQKIKQFPWAAEGLLLGLFRYFANGETPNPI